VKEGTATWDGVPNYQARNNLRKMKPGDRALFYHSGKTPAIVGIAEITKEFYPDVTAESGDWSVVDVKAVRKLKRGISLSEIKANAALSDMVLLKNSRLSVQPVNEIEFNLILKLAETLNT
jgi:predicted RNA-binding protein with PUA-like domain